MLTPEKIIDNLNMKPLEIEGGYYVETYRSEDRIEAKALPERYSKSKSISTAIYYLLTPNTKSNLHRLPTDEIYHFYLGDPVQMLLLYPDGRNRSLFLGSDIHVGQLLQAVVPGGVWQGAFLLGEGEFALMGTTVSPGFDFEDYEHGDRDSLISQYPQHEQLIKRLTT